MAGACPGREMADAHFASANPEIVNSSYVAIRVRARSEAAIAAALAGRGVPALCPVYVQRKRLSDRVKMVPAALFPCYIFQPYHSSMKRTIVTMPGVREIVSNGQQVLLIEGADLKLIRHLSLQGLNYRPTSTLCAGQKVKINSGPLDGLEGLLVRTKNESRVVLSVELLQRSVITEVDELDVTPVS